MVPLRLFACEVLVGNAEIGYFMHLSLLEISRYARVKFHVVMLSCLSGADIVS